MIEYVLAITAIINGGVVESTSLQSSLSECEESFLTVLLGREAQHSDLIVHACVPVEDAKTIGILR